MNTMIIITKRVRAGKTCQCLQDLTAFDKFVMLHR